MISNVPGIKIAGEAENSHEAMTVIEKVAPEIVLLDVRMPEGNGLELLANISQKNLSIIKIIVTNYAMRPYMNRCFELGADYFFDKSNEFEKLRELISVCPLSINC